MGPCYSCKRTIAIGGIKDQGFRFCSKECHAQKKGIIDALAAVPQANVIAEARQISSGRCSECGKTGGVEFHKSVFVWSIILFTKLSEKSVVCCRGCGLKSQALYTSGTLLLGWWGFPFGLIFTPVALVANAYQMLLGKSNSEPSKELMDYARERLARGYTSTRPERIEPVF